MGDIKAEKRALRKAIVARILAMDPAERRRQDAALVELLPGLPGFAEARTVLLYASAFPEEFDTASLLRLVLEAGKRLACPRVDRVRDRLALAVIADPARDLKPGMKGIPEPTAACPALEPAVVDWVLVPGIAFDPAGYRLGRGRGHFDRLLPTLRPEAPRWALALDPQWVDALPVEPHDQPLDGIAGLGRTVRRL